MYLSAGYTDSNAAGDAAQPGTGEAADAGAEGVAQETRIENAAKQAKIKPGRPPVWVDMFIILSLISLCVVFLKVYRFCRKGTR
jgi:hypothetical protein